MIKGALIGGVVGFAIGILANAKELSSKTEVGFLDALKGILSGLGGHSASGGQSMRLILSIAFAIICAILGGALGKLL